MSKTLPIIRLTPCPKGYTKDLDKAVSPAQTIAHVRERLAAVKLDILAETRRVDVGRLGIPVYLSVCGADAREIMPTRKQMGKGSSPEQARASALMELMERFAFFSFWQERPHMIRATWSEAETRFGDRLLPLEAMLRSVDDQLAPEQARRVLDLTPWQFYPATHLLSGRTVWLPLDWFKLLSEFNGTSAGNSAEESLLQGLSELVERHVCCRADRERPQTPTIDPADCDDPILRELLRAFEREGVRLVLKDFSLGMPLPTVAALAWDPATFPQRSEIVFTAGTAASPAKAAIRAVTEVAQLAGLMAAEIGEDVATAKRAGLLHDLGKAVDHELEGTHVSLGVEFARKYKEREDIIHAIEAHHNDVEPRTVVACLVQAADAISAARPGARRENLENYIKRLEQLETITGSYPGVDKAYAIQAGREVRVMVKPEQVSEDQMVILARDLAKKIEEEMEYPGQIKVHVLRETKVIEYAK